MSSSIKYLFCKLQKRLFFYSNMDRKSKKKQTKNDQQKHEFSSKFGEKSSRGPSGGPLAPLGVPKGSQTEFWEWKAGSLDPPWTPRWGPFFDFFSMQNSSDFLLVFWMHFGRIWHPFWRPKCIQNGVRNGKRVFLVLSVSCRRELNLGGFGTPKSIKMTSENRLENWQVF